MTIREQRLEIMRRVESGEISIDEGSRLLLALEQGQLPEPAVEEVPDPFAGDEIPPAEPVRAEPEVVETSEEEIRRRVDSWKRWWALPMAFGVILTILGAYWMYAGYQAAGLSWGFWLSWFPFLLGLAVAALSWWSQYLPWLHVRVNDNNTHVAVSMPLPVGVASWGLGVFRRVAPEEAGKIHANEIQSFLSSSLFAEDPLHVLVDDKDGSTVEVVIVGAAK